MAEALALRGIVSVMWWDEPEGPCLASTASVVLLRTGRQVQLERARAFAATGATVVNDVEAHVGAMDKWTQATRFDTAGVAHPPTALEPALLAGSGPVVCKPRRGHGGLGVTRHEHLPTTLAPDTLLQRFVEGEECRVIVVDGRVVSWATKAPAPGDFRGNLATGATMAPRAPSPDVATIACRAVRALGLAIAGVDVLVTDAGPVVLEVNATPTLFGPTVAATREAADAVADYLVALLAPKVPMKPARGSTAPSSRAR